MSPHKFQFRKTVLRNDFTTIFGGVGKRRTLLHFVSGPSRFMPRLSKTQKMRRAHQGWRNQKFGRLTGLKVRLLYGRHATVPQFRR